MINDEIKIVKAIGISTSVVAGIFILGLGFLAYRNYFEVVKLKLEIQVLKATLDVTAIPILRK